MLAHTNQPHTVYANPSAECEGNKSGKRREHMETAADKTGEWSGQTLESTSVTRYKTGAGE